jgi:hypothetical protein
MINLGTGGSNVLMVTLAFKVTMVTSITIDLLVTTTTFGCQS